MVEQQQEEDKRKKRLLPILLLFAVCLIGVGFAYVAWTENNEDHPSSEYIKLTQGGAGAYHFAPDGTKIYYDTYNSEDDQTFKYTLTDASYSNQPITGYTVVHVGKQFSLIAEKINGTNTNPLSAAFTSANFKYNGDWRVFIVITHEDSSVTIKELTGDDEWSSFNTTDKDSSFSIAYGSTSYELVTVDVYYGYSGIIGKDDPPWDYPFSNSDTDESALVFSVSTSGQQNVGISLPSEITVAPSTTGLTLEALVVGAPAATNVNWTTQGLINVSYSGDHNKVLHFDTGSVTTTVTVNASIVIDGTTYNASCTVKIQ